MDEVEVQWRVAWFPPDKPDQTFTGTEEAVRRRAEREIADNPIIDKREITVGPWVLVENLADRTSPEPPVTGLDG